MRIGAGEWLQECFFNGGRVAGHKTVVCVAEQAHVEGGLEGGREGSCLESHRPAARSAAVSATAWVPESAGSVSRSAARSTRTASSTWRWQEIKMRCGCDLAHSAGPIVRV